MPLTVSGGRTTHVKRVAWPSRHSKTLASVSEDGTVILWDVASQTGERIKSGGDFVGQIAWSPDDFVFAAAGDYLRLWHVDSRDLRFFDRGKPEAWRLRWNAGRGVQAASVAGGLARFHTIDRLPTHANGLRDRLDVLTNARIASNGSLTSDFSAAR